MVLNRHYKEGGKNKIMFVIDRKFKEVFQFSESNSVCGEITVRCWEKTFVSAETARINLGQRDF